MVSNSKHYRQYLKKRNTNYSKGNTLETVVHDHLCINTNPSIILRKNSLNNMLKVNTIITKNTTLNNYT